jgi:radial spoke head protein 4A
MATTEVKDDPALFQEAKEFLRGVPGGGTSVYDHLTQVLVKVLNERPTDANQLFEEVSSAVRDATVQEEAKLPTEEQLEEKCDVGAEHARRQVLNWTRDRTQLFVAPDVEVNAEVSFPDLMDESRLWQWGGVDFGDVTTSLLQLGLKQLACEQRLQIKFWGKIATRSGDYYIAQSLTKVNPSVGREARMVMEGTEGPNKYTYWVSTQPGGANTWTQLPFVTAAQLAVAQKIRRFFTGDLSAPVACYPPLPPTPASAAPPPPPAPPAEGEEAVAASPAPAPAPNTYQSNPRASTEANLLSAVVCLITADTSLTYAGFYEAEQEEVDGTEFNVIKPAEGPAPMTFDTLKDSSSFVHAELDINPVGRTQATPYPLNADGEPIEPEEPDAEPQAPLRSVAEDVRPLSDSENQLLGDLGLESKRLWQMSGENVMVQPSGPTVEEVGKSESNQSVAVLRSLKWPGAVTVAREGKTILNVYNGYGVLSSCMRPKAYEPPLPAPVEPEWKDPNAEEDADPTMGMIEQEDKIFEPKPDGDEE